MSEHNKYIYTLDNGMLPERNNHHKLSIEVCNQPHYYRNSHVIRDHTVLPATRQRWHSLLYHITEGITEVTHTHIHTSLTALSQGLPRWANTRKVKPIWILLKQETVSGSGISWAICMSASRSRLITTPAPHHSVFTGRMPFLPPSQQRESTEGTT